MTELLVEGPPSEWLSGEVTSSVLDVLTPPAPEERVTLVTMGPSLEDVTVMVTYPFATATVNKLMLNNIDGAYSASFKEVKALS